MPSTSSPPALTRRSFAVGLVSATLGVPAVATQAAVTDGAGGA